jgi:hypothetical protein
MAEEFLDDMLGNAGVDEAGADGVAELVSVHSNLLPGFVTDIDRLLPAAELT